LTTKISASRYRYQVEHQENNNKLAEGFAQLAEQKGCTPAQLALAWVLAQGDNIIPIPGTKRIKYLEENAGCVEIPINQADKDAIEALIAKYPDIGDRYSASNYKLVDKS